MSRSLEILGRMLSLPQRRARAAIMSPQEGYKKPSVAFAPEQPDAVSFETPAIQPPRQELAMRGHSRAKLGKLRVS